MREQTRQIQRVVFGIGTMAALTFGAAQAMAAPAQAQAAARACDQRSCMTNCVGNGGNGGFCTDGHDYSTCICY